MNRDKQTAGFTQRLHHGVVWAAGSQGATMLAQAGIVILLAKLGSASVLGRYALALSIVTPITLLSRLQLRGLVTTDARGEYRFGEYLALRHVTNCVAFAAVLVVLALMRPGWDNVATTLALTLVKLAENTRGVFLGRLQQSDQWQRITTASALRAAFGLVAFALTWTSSGNLPLALLTLGAADLLVLFAYEIPAVRALLRREGGSAKPLWHRTRMTDLARAALPMGGVAALVSLTIQMPRYFVEGFVGTEALGHWAAVMQITTATALILQPAGQASLARLAVYDQSNPVAFRRLFSSLLGAAGLVGVACAAGAYAIGDTVLALIYRPEYADLQPILVLTMVGAIAAHVSSVLGFTLTAARRFRAQFLLYSVTTVASAVACYLLIPTFGLTGAAYAHIATWVVACLGGGVVFIQHRRVRLGDTDLPEEPSTIKTEASGSVHPS